MANIIIVDDEDNIIGSMPRDSVTYERYRISALWLKNSENKILLAKRAYTKKHSPGKWGSAVAGTVEEDETYELNIVKEIEEELGIKNIKMKKAAKIKVDGEHNFFGQWFVSTINKPIEDFKIQEEEVTEIKWFSVEELSSELKNNPEKFTSNMQEYFKMFCSN